MKTVFTYLLTNMPMCKRCEGLEKLAILQDKLDSIADSIPLSFYLEECNNNEKYHKQLTARVCKCKNSVKMVCKRCELLADIVDNQDKLDNVADELTSGDYKHGCDLLIKSHRQISTLDCECKN